ncbi:MAG: helix-turn-helix domain-containing protein [Acidobacteria bacterium]|nr:helix-turn-helix domain-containing protein [Acidobacteriota bacterium]
MPWKVKNVMEQRVEFVVRVVSGEDDFSSLCREFKISRPTGYDRLERYESRGAWQD